MAAGRYWDRTRDRRVSRRGILQSAAVGIGGIAFAAACGGSSNSPTKSGTAAGGAGPSAATSAASFTPSALGTAQATAAPQVQSKLIPRTDTTAQAVPGGIYQSYTTGDATNLDPLSSQSFTANAVGAYMYPRLINNKPGFRVPANGEVAPGFAATWEQPEPTRLIMHLRQNAIWDRRAPTNGRQVDSSDVIFSWKKFVDKSISRAELANSVNPQAPLESLSAVDQYTVEAKTAFPYAPILNVLGFGRNLHIMPKESDGGFDPRNDTRGFGPWILQNYQRSVIFQYRKNPDYYLKDQKLPFLDGIDYPIVAEYAAGLAQFKAKKIWAFTPQQQDIVDTHKGQPELLLDKNAFGRTNWLLYFGLQPGSPFLDERVRQAASMLIDRDTWIDTFNNVSNFNKAGYGVNVRWHSHISSGNEGIWLDPKGKDLGEGAKNFAFNQAEAKKLLQAAGFNSTIETELRFIQTGEYGTTFPKQCDAFKGMLEDGGMFKLTQINPDYQTDYLPKIYYGKGDFKGIAIGASTQYPDVDGYMFAYYHTTGARQKVAFQGKNGDAKSDSLIEAQRKELDANKRIAIIQDWQRYMATKMLMIPFPGQAETFTLSWPWTGNFGVWRAWDAENAADETTIYTWFDKAKFTG